MVTEPDGANGRSRNEPLEGRSAVDRESLTQAERAMLPAAHYFARTHGVGDGTENEYLSQLPAARWEVTHRLLASHFLESPPVLPQATIHAVGELRRGSSEPPAIPTAVAHRIARWCDDRQLEKSRVALFPFPAVGAAVVAPVVEGGPFGRPRLAPQVTVHVETATDGLEHPLGVIDLIAPSVPILDEEQVDRIRRDTDQGVANLALARLAGRAIADGFDGLDTSIDSVDAKVAQSVTLERLAAIEGHPTYHAAKTHTGLGPVDSLLYTPECTDTIRLRFVAIETADVVTTSTANSPSFSAALVTTFPGIEGALSASLPRGTDPDDYTVLPVHPWQYANRIPTARRQVGARRIVPLEGYGVPASPLLGLRTVAPHGTVDGTPRPHVKLPVDVAKLTVERLLTVPEVTDGPRLSDRLGSILAEGPFNRLGLLDEFAGAAFQPGDGSTVRGSSVTDHLSAILREPPEAHSLVADEHTVVTAASLLAEPKAGSGPVVEGLVHQYADAEGITRPSDAAGRFLAEYAECVVPGSLRLMSEYGVGLEAHQQNTVLVLDQNAHPTAALIRDFGGIRIDPDRFERRSRPLDLHRDSRVAADIDAMYELYYALMMRLIGDLIVVLAKTFDEDAIAYWRIVRDVCNEVFATLRADAAVPTDQVDADAAELYRDSMEGLAPLTRQVGGYDSLTKYSAPNPLASLSEFGHR